MPREQIELYQDKYMPIAKLTHPSTHLPILASHQRAIYSILSEIAFCVATFSSIARRGVASKIDIIVAKVENPKTYTIFIEGYFSEYSRECNTWSASPGVQALGCKPPTKQRGDRLVLTAQVELVLTALRREPKLWGHLRT